MTPGGRWLLRLLGLAVIALVGLTAVLGVAIWRRDEATITRVMDLPVGAPLRASIEAELQDMPPAEIAVLQGAHLGIPDRTKAGLLAGASPDASILGDHALFYAARQDHVELIGLLLQAGADIDKKTRVAQRTALHEAALRGYLDSARLLLEYGADVNARNRYGRTPLYYAVSPPLPLRRSANWEEMKTLLLSHGAKK